MFEYYGNTLCVNAAMLYNKDVYDEIDNLQKDFKDCSNSDMKNAIKNDLDELMENYKNDVNTIITVYNYKALLRRNKLKVIQNGGNGRYALIEYESIPSRFKNVMVERFGNPRETVKKSRFQSAIKRNEEAENFYMSYRLDSGEPLPDKNIKEYISNAQILDAMSNLIIETKGICGKIGKLWSSFPETIENLPKKKYPHSLPKNLRALKNKFKDYQDNGYESIIHKGFCNDRSKKIKGAVADWWLAMYSLPNKVKAPKLMESYDLIKNEKGFPSLTINAVNKWLSQPEVERLWYLGRHGEEAYKNKYAHHLKRKKDNWFPNAYWAVDGSKLDWLHFYDNDRKMAAYLKINPVVDVFSEKIIGWSYSETENHVDHFNALKMAAETTNSKPYLFTYDNQSGHKSERMQQLYDKIVAKKGTHYANRARAHNSPVENVFKRLQQQVLNLMWFSDKQSPTVRTLDNKPNTEFLYENRKLMMTQDELFKAWEMCVKLWNESKHPKYPEMSRNEVYEMEKPQHEEIGLLEMVDIFWVFNRGSRYKKGGIQLEVANSTYEYEVLDSEKKIDIEFRRKNVGKKLYIKYDPNYLTDFVALYEKNEAGEMTFVANAEPKREHESIPVLMQDGDKEQWNEDYEVRNLEMERDLAELQKIRQRTGITPEQMMRDQETMIKMGGVLPKQNTNLTEDQLMFADL